MITTTPWEFASDLCSDACTYPRGVELEFHLEAAMEGDLTCLILVSRKKETKLIRDMAIKKGLSIEQPEIHCFSTFLLFLSDH